MNTEQLYKITKLEHLDGSLVKAAPDAKSYWESLDTSPNVDYWVVGYLKSGLPDLGECLVVDRIIRNGVQMPGIFFTTPCSSIEDISENEENPTILLHTQNSCYIIEKYES